MKIYARALLGRNFYRKKDPMLCEELPKIMWFENDNDYTECNYLFHYIIIPDVKEKTMTVKIWHGEYCYEKSRDEIVNERVFPLSNEGREEMIAFIREEDRNYRQ